MKKSIKVALWTALSLVVTGALVFVITMACLGWDFQKLSTTKYESNTHTVTDVFTKVKLETSTANVEIAPSQDTTCAVECFEDEKRRHEVTIEGDTLIVREKDTRAWYEHFGINFYTTKVTLYLPQSSLAEISAEVKTGNLSMHSGIDAQKVKLTTSTGDIRANGLTMAELNATTNTGKVSLGGIDASSLSVSTSTGDIDVCDVAASTVSVSTGTGRVSLDDFAVGTLDVAGRTGDIALSRVVASGTLTIDVKTGDVSFDRCDAGEIDIEISTGRVSGSLLSEKVFDVRVSTGRIDVPENGVGGTCKIRGGTGDVWLTIAR
ncbi:MAG: DUF4097 family beta strand repeat protein [Clostridia bacterium]|nr:DUF4097 family beta strand repeat protein [Clostridia bacterium]